MKAMMLAAGRGQRLRPFTDTLPKPLLPVGESTLIEHNLSMLVASGIEEVVINVCYRGDQLTSYLGDGSRYGCSITYSVEHEMLGTGGGVLNALPLLGDEPFLLLSSDIWSRYPIREMQGLDQADQFASALAHLVFVDNPEFAPDGDYALIENGLVSLDGEPKLTYAGIARCHPSLFSDCDQSTFSIASLWEKAMRQQLVTGEHYRGPWFNVGTEEERNRLAAFVAASGE